MNHSKPNSDNRSDYYSEYRQPPYTELDILDISACLWKGKKIIITVTVISVIFAIVYVMTVKEKWVSEAIVTLPTAGQVAEYNAALNVLYSQNPQDKPELGLLQQHLFGQFSSAILALSNALDNQEEPQKLSIEKIDKNSNEPLRISFTADSAESAKIQLTKYITLVNSEVVAYYSADIRRSMSVMTRELTDSLAAQKQIAVDKKQRRIEMIQQALKIANLAEISHSSLTQAEFLSDDTLYLLGSVSLQAMINNQVSRPLLFDENYYATKSALLAITHLKIQTNNLQSYRYIAPADLPIRRDSPKRALIVLLAAMVGVVIGSFIVLGRRLSQEYRQRKQH